MLLVFVRNHCPTSQSKFAELNRLTEGYDEVAVVGIDPDDPSEYPDDDVEAMVENVEAGRVRWDAYLRDDAQSVAAACGATCTPDPFLLKNADGTFRPAYHGRLDDALVPDEAPTVREMKGIIDTLRGSSMRCWRPGRSTRSSDRPAAAPSSGAAGTNRSTGTGRPVRDRFHSSQSSIRAVRGQRVRIVD
nr:thioredoxin family protein [Halobaculum salinum]